MSAPASRLFQLERALVAAEKRIALLDSLTPINFSAEVRRLTSSFDEGRALLPDFYFTPEPERRRRSESVAATLVAAQLALADTGFQKDLVPGLCDLLRGRIEELSFEVQMLRECGRPAVRELAVTRYPFTILEIDAARKLAEAWSSAQDDSQEDLFCEDGDCLLAAAFEEKRKQMGPLSDRVIIAERNLASLCAVGGAHLYVKRGVRVKRAEVERLWRHEVEGHLLPRLKAEQEPTPFSIGAPGSSIDEEGRAVLLEEKYGFLHAGRRRDLALRFLMALALREGGDDGVWQQLRHERERGVGAASLARAVCRIYRGGGLSRELIYLPGYLRVKATLEPTPSLDEFFQRGLVSVASLPFFARHFPNQARSR